MDKRGSEFSQQQRQAGAQGLVDDEGVEASYPCAEIGELRVGEVVEEEVCDESAAMGGRGLGENISLRPFYREREMGGAWREIVSSDFGLWVFAGELAKQLAIARADLGDVSGALRNQGCDPAFIAHKKVDAAQVLARAQRAGVAVRKVIEEFRRELAHGGIFGVLGDGRKRGNDECLTEKADFS